ncbi:MAG: aminopeptidase [Gammaproteobacteria bacterium]|nr:aminopeptidase [Gammaproteobacteria bacterium]
MNRRQPIEAILEDRRTEPALLERLRVVREIRDFASRVLVLPENGSYRNYVALDRPYVSWAVYAAPALSLTPKQWCFPVAGCVPYRGYFSKQEAITFAQRLRAQGLDVHVAGVTAYSTLGWFDDPLLSTMIRHGEASLAGLIFHELAHQRLYVDGDAALNEAFAMVVQQEGVRRWLKQNRSRQDLAEFEQVLLRRQDFYVLIDRLRHKLKSNYESDRDDAAKRDAKQHLFTEAQRAYRRLKKGWGGHSEYDGWFEQPLNNAKMVSVAVYHERIPDLIQLLRGCEGDLECFYQRVEDMR